MKEKQTPSFGYALFCLVTLAAFMVIGMNFLGAPLNVVMFLAWMLVNLLTLKLGYTYVDLEKNALDTVRNSLQAVVIMLAVGALIAVWIASGTVPTIIFYGMKVISAKYYLLTSLVLCSIVSVCTGTSWGTMGTVGVALLGVGTGLGIPVGMTAGAIISGSWFGDKLSPLSDTTNFASGVMEVNVITHVKHMLYTTVPAYVVSGIIFLFLGFKISNTTADFTMINNISGGLQDNFIISPITLIPMVVVIAMLLMRKAPAQSILTGAILGVLLAVFYQGFSPKEVLTAFYSGFNREFELEYLATLLNRGGMNSMNSTVQAVIFTTGIGGMIRQTGIIKVLFRSKGLKPENVSRICEDCGTIGVTIIPWGVTAVFIMNTLGISFGEYAPYAFFCYLCPVFSLLCGITGVGMARYKEGELEQIQSATEA